MARVKNRRSNANQCRPKSYTGRGKKKGLGRRGTFGFDTPKSARKKHATAAE